MLVGAVGGGLFTALGMPAAWLSGAMVATGVAALLGLEAPVPARFRDIVYVILGISMGSGVTPEVVGRMSAWPATLAGLALTVAGVTAGSYLFLRRVAGWDPATAYFGSIPGALSMTLATAELSRADLRRVSLSQTIRLFMLVAVLPVVVTSVEQPGGLVAGLPVLTEPLALLLLAACGIAGSALAVRLRIPAGVLIGAFLASSLLHLFSVVDGVLPDSIQLPAFVALGAFLGMRFAGTSLSMVLGTLAASFGAFAVALAIAAGGAMLAAALSGIPPGQVLVAFAPGGLEAMVILAFVLGVDPAFVAAHHLARFVAMTVVVPLAARHVLGPDWTVAVDAEDRAEA
nr:AbrB family transcriptional regulator [Chthonobacter albigriseus]